MLQSGLGPAVAGVEAMEWSQRAQLAQLTQRNAALRSAGSLLTAMPGSLFSFLSFFLVFGFLLVCGSVLSRSATPRSGPAVQLSQCNRKRQYIYRETIKKYPVRCSVCRLLVNLWCCAVAQRNAALRSALDP